MPARKVCAALIRTCHRDEVALEQHQAPLRKMRTCRMSGRADDDKGVAFMPLLCFNAIRV